MPYESRQRTTSQPTGRQRRAVSNDRTKSTSSRRSAPQRGTRPAQQRPPARRSTPPARRRRAAPPRHNYGVRIFMLVILAATLLIVINGLRGILTDIKHGDGEDIYDDVDISEYVTFDSQGDTLTISDKILGSTAQPDVSTATKGYQYIFNYTPHYAVNGRTIELTGDYLTSVSFDKSSKNMTLYSDFPLIFNINHSETEQTISITAENPKTLYDKIVLIDVGHGGSDPGASVGHTDEKALNLEISLKVLELFEKGNSGIKAYVTRTDDYFLELSERTRIGNEIADLFVSIHNNTYIADTSVNGTETQYRQTPVAGADESGSRFYMSNRHLAELVQSNIVALIGSRDRGVVSRDNLVVLNTSTIPAVLVEVGFMTNPSELKSISSDEYQQQVAQGIYNGIIAAFAGE